MPRNLVLFDLEWNIGYQPFIFNYHGVQQTFRGEIIEIGAVKIDEDANVLDTFSIHLRPRIFRCLQHHIAKVTGLTQEDLDRGEPIIQGLRRFMKWCGPDAEFAEWGMDDVPVLKQNLFLCNLDESCPTVWYDLQQLFLREYPRKEGEGMKLENVVTRMGIPLERPFHDALSDTLYTADLCRLLDLRAGQVRILMGSTPKLGAGTNVQDRLIALHHLDCPWKPSDLEQQEGRILRQGNQNDKVKIFRYVTENTFDAYMWQILENKQKFISQIMTSKSPVRACEDVDDTALSYAEIKALATGNPYIKEKMDLDVQVSKLKLLKANHTSQIYRLESDIAKNFPVQISALKERIAGMQIDSQVVKSVDLQGNDTFAMTVGNVLYEDKKEAGEALIAACAGL